MASQKDMDRWLQQQLTMSEIYPFAEESVLEGQNYSQFEVMAQTIEDGITDELGGGLDANVYYDQRSVMPTYADLGEPIDILHYGFFMAPKLPLYTSEKIRSIRSLALGYPLYGIEEQLVIDEMEQLMGSVQAERRLVQEFGQMMCKGWVRVFFERSPLNSHDIEEARYLCSQAHDSVSIRFAILDLCTKALAGAYIDLNHGCDKDDFCASCEIEAEQWYLRILYDWLEEIKTPHTDMFSQDFRFSAAPSC